MKYQNYRNVLSENRQLGPFPTHHLKRVDRPTTMITDSVQRIDARGSAIAERIQALSLTVDGADTGQELAWDHYRETPVCSKYSGHFPRSRCHYVEY